MNFVLKVINSGSLVAAKANQNACAIIAFDEPKMPNFMIK